MWLLLLLFSAVIATFLWYAFDNGEYRFDILSLILWGASIMVLIDHIMGYIMEGGEFIEMTSDATVLGIILVITALIVWEILLLWEDPKHKIRRSHHQ